MSGIKINSIALKRPDLLTEWDFKRNELIDPYESVCTLRINVWWICKTNKDHTWSAQIRSRAYYNQGCPYCSGNKVHSSTCLEVTHPLLVTQWHMELNGLLTPKDVSKGYTKRVWWICEEGHEWPASPNTRTANNTRCPFCRDFCIPLCDKNSLATINPPFLKEWHPTKNVSIRPRDVTASSPKKVWWLCSSNPLHEWQATVNKRSSGRGCPYCSGNRVHPTTCLAVTHPEVAAEWHPIRNGDKTPQDVTKGHKTDMWWLGGCGHEWQMTPNRRTASNGNCVYCTPKPSTSFPEQTVYFYMQQVYPDSINRHILSNENVRAEVDVYIPSLKLAIEYDGFRYHSSRERQVRDMQKNLFLASIGITLIRIREKGLPNLDSDGCMCIMRDKKSVFSLNITIKKLLQILPHSPSVPEDFIDVQRDKSQIYMYLTKEVI